MFIKNEKDEKINISEVLRIYKKMGNIKSKKLAIDYCICNNRENFEKLLNSTNKININTNIQPYANRLFSTAFRYNRIDIVKCLLKYCEKYKLNVVNDYLIMVSFRLYRTEILIELLNHRCSIHMPFDIETNEEIIYSIGYRFKCREVYKILFEYGEKMNYKLDIYKISYSVCDKYLKNLIKHNYSFLNNRYDRRNGLHLSSTLCNNKNLEIIIGIYYKYVRNNNVIHVIHERDFHSYPLYYIDYIFCISYI